MGEEAKCKLGQKARPTQTKVAFCTFTVLCSRPRCGMCAVVSLYTDTQGGINLGTEQVKLWFLVSYFSF